MRLLWLALALLLLFAAPAAAQQRFGVELRGGASFPIGALPDGFLPGAELGPGPSFSVHLHIPRRTRGALLLGFAQNRFRCTGPACGDAGDLVMTGWSIATRMALGNAVSVPWVRLGVTFDRSEWDFPVLGGTERLASSFSVGGEAGLGYTIQLAERLTLNPGVRYGVVKTQFPRGERLRAQYVVGDLAFVVGF